MTLDLPLIWAGLIGFGVFMYVLMDGFDLGVGILFRFAPDHEGRDIMMNSVAPIWDGNETWLVLGGTLVLAAYPVAYGIILSALYLPLIVMLAALIFRGVAFEFRFKAHRSRFLWDVAFNLGSTLAAFAQGVVLGAYVHGFEVAGGQYAGTPFAWLTPFSLLTGAGIVAGYALLGAGWIVRKTEGALQEWAYRLVPPLVGLVLLFMTAVSLWVPFLEPKIAERWFTLPNILFLWPVPLSVAAVAALAIVAVRRRYERVVFPCAMALFGLGYLGLVISLFPNIVPPSLSIWAASAPPESQRFLIAGFVFIMPAIVAYTTYSYWVFRGKVTAASAHYHE